HRSYVSTEEHFTERMPAGQTSFPPAVPVSKALARSDNEPQPPSFVSQFLQGHTRTDSRRAPISLVHAPRFAQLSGAWLKVSSLRERLRAVCRVDPDTSLRLLLSKR